MAHRRTLRGRQRGIGGILPSQARGGRARGILGQVGLGGALARARRARLRTPAIASGASGASAGITAAAGRRKLGAPGRVAAVSALRGRGGGGRLARAARGGALRRRRA